jgi:intimin
MTIALAPLSYQPPQVQQATVVGTSTTLDLSAVTPNYWIGQGATLAVPLTVEALDLGVPLGNVTVNFVITRGTATLSAGSATTNGQGFATVTANVTNLSSNVQVSACVSPNNSPCQSFALFATPVSGWTLETVSGSTQVVPVGQAFQSLVMRVTDGSAADNPVLGTSVTFGTTLTQLNPEPGGVPVLLGSSTAQVVSAQNGMASIVPSTQNVGPCAVFITVTAGAANVQLQMESVPTIIPTLPDRAHSKPVPASRGSVNSN